MPHIHEAIDNTVAAFIVYHDSVALVHHRGLKRWLPIGGHIELDQDTEEALFAEIEQESGIKPEELEFSTEKPNILSPGTKFLHSPNRLDIHEISRTHKHIGNIYYLRSFTDRLVLAEEESVAIRWFTKDELADSIYNLSPAVKFYALEALQTFHG